LIGTAYFAHAAEIVARSLTVLGRVEEATEYQRLFEEIQGAFCQRFVEADGRMTGDTQCDYVLALRFGLMNHWLRDDIRHAAFRHLVSNIEAKDWHLSTGFVGVSHLLQVLTDNGEAAVAWQLLLQDTFPSWLFPVKHGATTIWERWNGWTPETGAHPDASMNSFNHYSLGSCGHWFYAYAAGIDQQPDSAGFERLEIRPHVGGGLTAARATYRSIHGEIVSAWAINGGTLSVDITIPVNTWAYVHLPVSSDKDVRESGRPLDEVEGATALRKNGELTLRVESGTFRFTMPWK
jgi:alpha-L-rhamnosidase